MNLPKRMIIGTEAEFYIGVNTVTVGTQCILDLQSTGSSPALTYKKFGPKVIFLAALQSV